MPPKQMRLIILVSAAVILAVVAGWRLLGNDGPLPDDDDFARIEQLKRDGNVEALGAEVANPETRVAVRAVMALGSIETSASASQIEKAMADGRSEVRAAAAIAFSRAATRDQAGTLGRLIADSDPSVRAAAATALGEMRACDQIELLLGAMTDPKSRVRGRAVAAVEMIVGLHYGIRPTAPVVDYDRVAARIRADFPKMRGRIEEEHSRK